MIQYESLSLAKKDCKYYVGKEDKKPDPLKLRSEAAIA